MKMQEVMRYSLALLVAIVPAVALAQAPDAAARKKETLKWLLELQSPTGGFYMAPKESPQSDVKQVPSLRATSAAVRAIKYLGGDLPNKDRHAAFVLTCFDPKTGGFAEPAEKPNVTTTSIGVMAAVELGIPKEKFARAMDYLKENAKTFEDVRIGAAAVEAWGVKECPFKLENWDKIAKSAVSEQFPVLPAPWNPFEMAREWGSFVAFKLRLGLATVKEYTSPANVSNMLSAGQQDDGGWGKPKEKSSDIETTYRVMRAIMLLKGKPKDISSLRKFIESHRNKDGGYATKPGDKSSAGGVYYAVIISKWLDEMEMK
jgi:prenyltransferase beta subunit